MFWVICFGIAFALGVFFLRKGWIGRKGKPRGVKRKRRRWVALP
jgi:hypothetical protein